MKAEKIVPEQQFEIKLTLSNREANRLKWLVARNIDIPQSITKRLKEKPCPFADARDLSRFMGEVHGVLMHPSEAEEAL